MANDEGSSMSKRRGRFWYWTVETMATDLMGTYVAYTTVTSSSSAAYRLSFERDGSVVRVHDTRRYDRSSRRHRRTG